MITDLRQQVIAAISAPSERTKQRTIGPSGLGNPCTKCLARELLGEKQEQDFSMYPWIGTAVHFYLEHNSFPQAQHELRVHAGDIEGIGAINGTTDMLMDGEVVDWKIVGLKKIKEYRIKGIPKQYRYQGQIYARACANAGLLVDSVGIVFIPRDSGDVNDIWVHEEEYNPEFAEKAFARAQAVYDHALANGYEDLESDPGCYNCNMNWR